MHWPEVIGTRNLHFGFEKWQRINGRTGYPDGDPIFTGATLVKALQVIAKSNRHLAELLVRDIYRLRKTNADFSKLLPSLQSTNTEALIVELKGYNFYNAASLTPK